MTNPTVTLTLPLPLYERLKARADQAQRSVEAEALDMLVMAVPVADELPAELEAAIASLATLDDAALWQAARTRLAPDAADQLEQLHFKQQREGLTDAEQQAVDQLVQQYERVMLVRAQAAALLQQRGHNVSSLLQAA